MEEGNVVSSSMLLPYSSQVKTIPNNDEEHEERVAKINLTSLPENRCRCVLLTLDCKRLLHLRAQEQLHQDLRSRAKNSRIRSGTRKEPSLYSRQTRRLSCKEEDSLVSSSSIASLLVVMTRHQLHQPLPRTSSSIQGSCINHVRKDHRPLEEISSVNEKGSSLSSHEDSSSCFMHHSSLCHTRITFLLLTFLVNSIQHLLNWNFFRGDAVETTTTNQTTNNNHTNNDEQQTQIMLNSSRKDCHRNANTKNKESHHRKVISLNNNTSVKKSFLFLPVLLTISCLTLTCVSGLKTDTSWHTTSSNESSSKGGAHLKCIDGLVFPAWQPLVNLSGGDIFARGLVYFLSLIYLFLGVSIVSDRFMSSIEVITSQEKEVTITKPNGETQVISVRVWNETVSNLTLMALGSSTPEILLSIIEVYAQDFDAGDLGPGTIVGSAAFNLFVIIAICVWVIPTPEVKKIKHLRVFFVTMVWSVFAYIWLYAILTWSSYGEVTIFEGALTFAFFPMTVGTAYIADKRLLVYKYLSKSYRANKRGIIVTGEGGEDMEMGVTGSNRANNVEHRRSTVGAIRASLVPDPNEEMNEFERHRMEYINIIKELRRKNPDASVDEIEQMAREEIFNRGPKSRAFYRLQVRDFRFTLLFDKMLDLWFHFEVSRKLGYVLTGCWDCSSLTYLTCLCV